ncbi:MAG: glycosyltransferase family 2 protein [Pyrinomonadaceae bacterium]
MKVSAVIITYNEEKNIEEAIRSTSWADEILVVDSESTDRTRELAESMGAKVLVNPWPGFSAQKQFAVDHASNDWIFSLDADERVTDTLENEIRELIKSDPPADGYKIPRLSVYMGRPIRHGGWYPDLQLRLFDRRRGRWNGLVVHESVEMDKGSRLFRLSADILHYSVESAAHHNKMIAERYAPLGAQKIYQDGRRTSQVNAVVSAMFAFTRAYLLKLGFLDGFAGFCIAYFAAHHTLMKHLMLIELSRSKGGEKA